MESVKLLVLMSFSSFSPPVLFVTVTTRICHWMTTAMSGKRRPQMWRISMTSKRSWERKFVSPCHWHNHLCFSFVWCQLHTRNEITTITEACVCILYESVGCSEIDMAQRIWICFVSDNKTWVWNWISMNYDASICAVCCVIAQSELSTFLCICKCQCSIHTGLLLSVPLDKPHDA